MGQRNLGKPRRANAKRVRAGVAVVEMAVVGVFLVMLILGIVEIGRAIHAYQILEGAARAGGRLAVSSTGPDGILVNDQRVKDAVLEYIDKTDIPKNDVTVTISPSVTVTTKGNPPVMSGPNSGDEITVTASVPYSKISYLKGSWWLTSKNIKAEVVVQRE